MDIRIESNCIAFDNIECFDIDKSCACGQAFRWRPFRGGMLGVVRGCAAYVLQDGRSIEVYAEHRSKDYANMWANYFDLHRDYASIEATAASDPKLGICFPAASGIRVFNQEPFEALISFIVSQNNNIKRISGIVERLCALCGEELSFMGERLYAFPTPEAVASLAESSLVAIGTGYRAPYIVEAARRICGGFDMESLRTASLADARKALLGFHGIGPKVADCILLFSLGHTDAFPIDVWIDRAVRALYFNGGEAKRSELVAAAKKLGEYSGILQQYIFCYARQAGRHVLS